MNVGSTNWTQGAVVTTRKKTRGQEDGSVGDTWGVGDVFDKNTFYMYCEFSTNRYNITLKILGAGYAYNLCTEAGGSIVPMKPT